MLNLAAIMKDTNAPFKIVSAMTNIDLASNGTCTIIFV